MNYLQDLNDKQTAAVTHKSGPLKVIAGAGTGKTRVLTRRIAHLLENGTDPEQILALTFTNKAATEMKERVGQITPADGLLISTFHSLGARLLRRHAEHLDVERDFAIYDTADSKKIIKRVTKVAGLDTKQWKPKKVFGFISSKKSEGVHADTFRKNMNDEAGFAPVVARIWPRYEQQKTAENALDFSDLLLLFRDLLRDTESVRDKYQKRFTHVLVDEYQDTSRLQAEITRLLAEPENNLFVVGDGDQTIYSWRGASVENILGFENQFDNANTVILDTNYRSSSHIIQAANDVISHNEKRDEKTLKAAADAGEKLTVKNAHNETHEAQAIVQEIQANGNPQDWAVLYRTNAQSRSIEEALMTANIPYSIAGTSFFDRKEVRDVLAYIRVALNPAAETPLRRIISRPRRGIGNKTLKKMLTNEPLSDQRQKAVNKFWDTIGKIREDLRSVVPSQAIANAINSSGLADFYADDRDRQENMAGVADMAAEYDSAFSQDETAMQSFLENLTLASDQDKLGDNGVKLMTIHAAKGLEFPHVWIAGLEDGLFPSDRGEDDRNEEERRLFYVAVTRAEERLVLSHASSRRTYGKREWQTPSPFLEHISPDLIADDQYDQTGGGSDDVVFFD